MSHFAMPSSVPVDTAPSRFVLTCTPLIVAAVFLTGLSRSTFADTVPPPDPANAPATEPAAPAIVPPPPETNTGGEAQHGHGYIKPKPLPMPIKGSGR